MKNHNHNDRVAIEMTQYMLNTQRGASEEDEGDDIRLVKTEKKVVR
jgi:hypothetical protein